MRPDRIGASGVFLLCLPVELQRPAQLTLILCLLAHQVHVRAVARGQAGVALIGGDFHELAVVQLVEAQNALLGGKQGAEQYQPLRLARSLFGIRDSEFEAGVAATSCSGVDASPAPDPEFPSPFQAARKRRKTLRR